MRNKINNKILIYILTAIIIVFSDDTMLFGTNYNEQFIIAKYFVQLFLLVIFILIYINDQSIRRVGGSGKYCIALCVLVALSMMFNADLRFGYFYTICIIVLSYLLSYYVDLKLFFISYDKIMFALAVCSIIGMFVAKINPNMFDNFPTIINASEIPFKNAFVFIYSDLWDRSFGIFREPGVFQLYIILGMIFHLYCSDKVSVIRTILYSIAVVLTYSTTGFIALFVVLALCMVKLGKQNKKAMLLLSMMLCVGVVMLLTKTNILSLDGIVFDKFRDTGVIRATTASRYSSITSNIKMWLTNPLFGCGLSYVDTNFPLMTIQDYGVDSRSNTNTLLCMLSTYGVFFVWIIIKGYLRLIRFFTKRKIEILLIVIVLLVLSCGERIICSPIVYVLCFGGMQAFYENRSGVDG